MSYVWLGKDGKTIFLQHCPKCSLENWAPSVASGVCAWCAYKADKKDVENDFLKQQLEATKQALAYYEMRDAVAKDMEKKK